MNVKIVTVTEQHRRNVFGDKLNENKLSLMDGAQNVIVDFESYHEFREFFEKRCAPHASSFWHNRPDRTIENTGGQSERVTMKHMTEGHAKFARAAKEWTGPQSFRTRAAQIHAMHRERCVTGGFTSVPAYLAGVPNCMRRTRRTQTDTHVIRVMADLGGYSHVTAAQLQQRAAVICGFIKTVSRLRPMELYGCFSCDIQPNAINEWLEEIKHPDRVKPDINNDTANILFRVKLNASPLNFADVGTVFGDVGFFRGVMFHAARVLGQSSLGQSWKRCMTSHRVGFNERERLSFTDAEPGDVLIVNSSNEDDLNSERGAEKWLNSMLDAAMSRDAETDER